MKPKKEEDPLKAMAGLWKDAIGDGDQPIDAVELVKEARERDSLKPKRIRAVRRLGDYCKNCEDWTPYDDSDHVGKCTNEDSPLSNADTSDLHSCEKWSQRKDTIHLWLELKVCAGCGQELYIPEDREHCLTCRSTMRDAKYGFPIVELYHLWLPKKAYDTVTRLAEEQRSNINDVLVDLVLKALEWKGLL